MRYLLLFPAILLAASVALYLWASYDLHPFDDWESAYD